MGQGSRVTERSQKAQRVELEPSVIASIFWFFVLAHDP